MFYKHIVIVEEVKAWKKCPERDGKGGKWHEAVVVQLFADFGKQPQIRVGGGMKQLTKTSVLIREHAVCPDCRGSKIYSHIYPLEDRGIVPCGYCLKDADGNSTGAEPGTATSWRLLDSE